MHNCVKEEAIESILLNQKVIMQDVIEIKTDLKDILAIKNKVAGAIKLITLIGTILAFVVGTVISLLKG